MRLLGPLFTLGMYNMAYTKSRINLNIRPLLAAKGMSLVALAKETGLNRAALHEQAAGKAKRVDYETLRLVKKALGVTWDELLK